MARRLGIVTIVDHANYGNRLQNYAVQEVLRSLGFDPETIVSRRFDGLDPARRVRYLREKLAIGASEAKTVEQVRDRVTRALMQRRHGSLIAAKTGAGLAFTRHHIKLSAAHVTPVGFCGARAEDYEGFIVGSDQVWKPAYRNGAGPEFLDFAPPAKRIAYSASFGVSTIPPVFVERYRQGIGSMAAVSVREVAGKDIVETLCGFTPAVTVDPTLMLPEAHWRRVAAPHPRKPGGDYLLRYFLSQPSAETERAIEECAGAAGLATVTLADVARPLFYDAGPAEFLDLLGSASLVCTDSFHGVIFSLIFQRPFVVFTRSGSGATMNSRIDTLLGSFRLQDHLHAGGRLDPGRLRVDHQALEAPFAEARAHAMVYLQTALGRDRTRAE